MALVWLLDINIGGRELHASTRPVTFDGRQYQGTLDELTVTEQLAIATSPGALEVTVDLVPEVNVAELVSQGHTLTDGTATLRLWDDDQGEHLAEVLMLDARCSAPEFGADNEALSFQLSSEPFDELNELIESTAEVNDETWANRPDESDGAPYPQIYGTPGSVTGEGSGTIRASIGIAVESVEGDVHNLAATAISADQVTMASGTKAGGLYTGMQVTYDEALGGGWGLTDGDVVFVKHIAGEKYELYSDEGLDSQITGLSGTPSSTESFTIDLPYATKYLLAGHPVASTSVSVRRERASGSLSDAETYTITEEADALGRIVATIDTSLVGTSATAQYAVLTRLLPVYVAWADGGAYRSTGSGTLLYVGGLLADLARASSLPYDVGSFLVAADGLQVPVGLALMESETPSDLLVRLVGLLPIGLYTGPRGITAIRLPTAPDRARAVELVDGINSHRVGPVATVNDSSDLATRVRIRFAHSAWTDSFRRKVAIGTDPSKTSSDVYMRTTAIAQRDVEQGLVEDIDWTYSAQTARLVARWLARQASATPRRIEVDVPYDVARGLRLGQSVLFTSDDLSITEAQGFVSKREISTGALWRVELYFLLGVNSDPAKSPTGGSSTPPSEYVTP